MPLMALVFYVVTIVYPIVRIWSWYEPAEVYASILSTIALIAALGLPLYVFVGRFILRIHISKQWMPWLYAGIGGLFLSFPVVLAIEILRWLPFFPSEYASLGAVLGTLLLWFYSLLNAQRLHVKKVQLQSSEFTNNESLVQLSDVHIGSRSPKYLKRIVDRVIQLNPTWVVITGDLLDSSDIGPDELTPLRRIADRTLLVMGNHERYEGIDRVTVMLKSLGIQVLRNEARSAGAFQFVGIDDGESPEVLSRGLMRFSPSEDAFRVLLHHRPQGMEQAAAWGFDLMLAGHTHRGQLFPFEWVVKRFFALTHGTHLFGNMTLHISMGTGTWGPSLRLGSRNEITHLVFA